MTKLRDHPVWNRHIAEEKRKELQRWEKEMRSRDLQSLILIGAAFFAIFVLPTILTGLGYIR